MSFLRCRQLLLAAVLACIVVLGAVGSAEASNKSIVATFKASEPKINKDEVAVAEGLLAYQNQHTATPAITALRKEVGDIHKLTAKISGESSSSAKGAEAKADIVKGLKLIATSYASLATDLQKSSAGAPVARSKVQGAVNTDKKGRTDLIHGLKLLA